MPIYGYACTNCGHSLDALQKIADDPLTDCPECETPGLKRQLSAPRFRLKGQGWYETDFKKDNQRNIAGETVPSKDADKADGKKDAAADTKKAADTPKAADTAPPAKTEAKTEKKTAAKESPSS